MPQLAIAELCARLDTCQDLPTETAEMLILQLGEAVAEFSADLHLEAFSRLIDIRKTVVFVVAVFVVGVARRAWSRDVLGVLIASVDLRDPFAAYLIDPLDPGVIVGHCGPCGSGLLLAGGDYWWIGGL